MTTRLERLSEFSQAAPPTDKAVELLCEDHVGTYLIPSLCRWVDGKWVTAERETTITAKVSTDRRNTLIFKQRWSVDMKRRRRVNYSLAQRSEIWDRWQAGEPMSSIGRRFDRDSSLVLTKPFGERPR